MNRSPYRYIQGKKISTELQSITKSSPKRYRKANTATHRKREER